MLDYRIWYNHGEYPEYKGFKIYARENKQMDKPALLLLHGFPTSSYDWYKIWPKLHKNYRLIAFDFLGFGYSDKPYPYNYSIEEQTDITEFILRHYNVTECYIMAHDYAVSVAQEMLARRIEDPSLPKIRKLIFLNGGLFPETHIARPIQKLLLGRWGKLANKFLGKESLKKNLNNVFGPNTKPSDIELEAFWNIINHKEGKRCFHLTIHYMNDRIKNRERWLSALQNTSTPLRLVNGPEDPVSGRHMVERYKELIPNPDIVLLDEIGHYPNVESPQEIVWQVMQYFS